MIRPIVKYHGGKGRIFRQIIPHIPSHDQYLEPFGGAASVLLNKTPCEIETYNDLEPTIANLFVVVQDEFADFFDAVTALSYDRETYFSHRAFYRSQEFAEATPLKRAIATYVVCRMSRGGLGGTFSWSKRIYSGGVPSEVSAWLSSFANLEKIHERIRDLQVLNQCGLTVVQKMDNPDLLIYADPPYLHSTRSSINLYKLEMQRKEHERLAGVLKGCQAKVILSGYNSDDYNEWFKDWRVVEFKTANHSSHKAAKQIKTEKLFMNF